LARIRSVKPELRTSLVVAGWPIEVRYFWVLLWGYLDDKGRGLDIPKTIAGDCFPHDNRITARTVDGWLTTMAEKPDHADAPLCRYEVAGKRYVHATNWGEHQRINRPTPSRLRPCPIHEGLTEPLTESPGGGSLPGAAEQQSRGAEEQQQPRSEPLAEHPDTPAAVRVILDAVDGCSGAEARHVAQAVQATRRPRNLVGLLRTIAAAGELPALVAEARSALTPPPSGPKCPRCFNALDSSYHRRVCLPSEAEPAATLAATTAEEGARPAEVPDLLQRLHDSLPRRGAV
jgi:hypothetical protein